jgi:hypothetical protein
MQCKLVFELRVDMYMMPLGLSSIFSQARSTKRISWRINSGVEKRTSIDMLQ